jgi:hypothetical protein
MAKLPEGTAFYVFVATAGLFFIRQRIPEESLPSILFPLGGGSILLGLLQELPG